MYNNNILEKYTASIEGYYYCCDFKEGGDGLVSIDEVLQAVDGQGVFINSTTPGETLKDGDVTLEMLEGALRKVDLTQDGNLDKIEFILLALDRKILFSRENLIELFLKFDQYDVDGQNKIHIGESFYGMMADNDGNLRADK